jgi:hypothetical protein
MSDGESIPKLMEIASDSYQLQTAQHVAAKKAVGLRRRNLSIGRMRDYAVSFTSRGRNSGAGHLPGDNAGQYAQKTKNWQVISVGQQQPGDVGSTCGVTANHGSHLSCIEAIEFR